MGSVPVDRRRKRGSLAAVLAAGLACVASAPSGPALAAPAAAAEPPTGSWDFRVFLDGKPIGSHRFTVIASGAALEVTSRASFSVSFLGFTAYRYRHDAKERWRGGCLAGIDAATDDNGRRSEVRFEPPADECVLSFAYWHPAMRSQTRLLNAQTGQLEPVQVRPIADASVSVKGEAVAASGVRISGPPQPIDVWYGADGRWIGLDTTVGGKRKLSYRLQ